MEEAALSSKEERMQFIRKQKMSGHGLETQVQFVPKHCIPIRYQFYEFL